MINKMYRVLAVLCMVLVLPVLVSAELQGLKPLGKDSNPTKTVGSQPPANAKLNLINNLRQGLKMTLVQSVPPAKVILTSQTLVSGGNYMKVMGYYSPVYERGAICLRFNKDASYRDFLGLYFTTVPGKTYLLDVSIASTTKAWTNLTDGTASTVNEQQGHLFIVFIASGASREFALYPPDLNYGPGLFTGYVYSAELTQIN